jgi:YaiO family outer membrane protein
MFKMLLCCRLPVLLSLLIVTIALPVRGESIKRTVEVGFGYGDYTENLGSSNAQSVALIFASPGTWSWRFDLGRQSRFGEDAFGFGISATRAIPGRFTFGAGISTGTGDILMPEYRYDLSLNRPILADQVIASASYTRVQSKDVNKSDGYGLGLTWWAGEHWILGASGRHEIGYPGRTISRSADLNASYGTYMSWYVGAGYRFGGVSYTLLGAGLPAVVDYDEEAWYLVLTRYFSPEFGGYIRFEQTYSDIYDITSFRLVLFRDW